MEQNFSTDCLLVLVMEAVYDVTHSSVMYDVHDLQNPLRR